MPSTRRVNATAVCPSSRSMTARRSPPACRITATSLLAPSRYSTTTTWWQRIVPRTLAHSLSLLAGHHHALCACHWPLRRAPLRLGLPRPPDRVRDRQEARRQDARPGACSRHSGLQRRVPQHRDALLVRLGVDRQAPRPLDRLSARLQDHGHELHGERLVGLQAALRQEAHLPRLQGHAVLDRVQHAALQLRGQPAVREHARPRDLRLVPAARRARHQARRLDHHALDAAEQRRPLRQPDARLRARQGQLLRRHAHRRRGLDPQHLSRAQEGRQARLHRALQVQGNRLGRLALRAVVPVL